MDLKKHAGLDFLFDVNSVAIDALPDRARPRRAEPDAGDARLLSANCIGWAFGSEENLIEFVEELLKKNPTAKYIKYSPNAMFETVPSPMQKKAWFPEDGVFK